jgi:hypothetical protein
MENGSPQTGGAAILRYVLGAFLLASLSWLAWLIVVTANWDGVMGGASKPADFGWEYSSSSALLAAARDRFTKATSAADAEVAEEAKALAQKTLAADPLQQGALVLLSDIAARYGDNDRSEKLLRLAGARSLRDIAAQAKMIDLLVAKADYTGAIAKADMYLRVNPGVLSSEIMGFLTSAAVDPRSAPAMIDQLATHPMWREALFGSFGKYKNSAPALRLLSGLAAKGDELKPSDLSPTLNFLIQQGNAREAHAKWIEFLAARKRPKARMLFDGDLTERPSGVPFEWTLNQSPGVVIDFVETSGSEQGERMLRGEFLGTKVSSFTFDQTLFLRPGRYRFTAQAMTEDLRTARGVAWRISCGAVKQQILGETEQLRGSRPWREIGADFEVPLADCDHQRIQLVLVAKAPIELTATGAVFFKNLEVSARSQSREIDGANDPVTSLKPK